MSFSNFLIMTGLFWPIILFFFFLGPGQSLDTKFQTEQLYSSEDPGYFLTTQTFLWWLQPSLLDLWLWSVPPHRLSQVSLQGPSPFPGNWSVLLIRGSMYSFLKSSFMRYHSPTGLQWSSLPWCPSHSQFHGSDRISSSVSLQWVIHISMLVACTAPCLAPFQGNSPSSLFRCSFPPSSPELLGSSGILLFLHWMNLKSLMADLKGLCPGQWLFTTRLLGQAH